MFSELVAYAQRTGLVVEPGFASKKVRWMIDLDLRGKLLSVKPASATSFIVVFPCCPDLQPPELLALPSKLQAQGITMQRAAHFLLDTCGTVNNWTTSALEASKTQEKHQAFQTLVALAASEVQSLQPIQSFLSSKAQLELLQGNLLTLKAQSTDSISFSIDGQTILERDTWHSWWREFRLKCFPTASILTSAAISVVTGEKVVPAKTHPKLTRLGVGAPTFGVSLVSFNKPAFQSFGLQDGHNAPLSADQAAAYRAALDSLLSHAPTLGLMKVAHWYEQTIQSKHDPFWTLFDPNSSDGNASNLEQAQGLEVQFETTTLPTVLQLDETRCFVLAVAAADGRAKVKDWQAFSVRSLVQAINCWFRNLEIVQVSGLQNASPAGLESLLGCLRCRPRATKEAFLNYIAPVQSLQLSLLKAALNSHIPIPETIAIHALNALRSSAGNGDMNEAFGGASTESARLYGQLGIMKAYLQRKGDRELHARLNLEHPNTAYQCGRLAAVLIRNQRWALHTSWKKNDHILFGLALVTPAAKLEPLVWTSFQHLNSLSATRPGLLTRLREQLSTLWEALGGSIPAVFTLDEQLYFCLGYFQQLTFDQSRNTNQAATLEFDLEEHWQADLERQEEKA
jgi:CRISPR-associated protein Csd1